MTIVQTTSGGGQAGLREPLRGMWAQSAAPGVTGVGPAGGQVHPVKGARHARYLTHISPVGVSLCFAVKIT